MGITASRRNRRYEQTCSPSQDRIFQTPIVAKQAAVVGAQRGSISNPKSGIGSSKSDSLTGSNLTLKTKPAVVGPARASIDSQSKIAKKAAPQVKSQKSEGMSARVGTKTVIAAKAGPSRKGMPLKETAYLVMPKEKPAISEAEALKPTETTIVQPALDAMPEPTTMAASDAMPEPTTMAASDAVPEATTMAASDAVPEPTIMAASEAMPEPTTEAPMEAMPEPAAEAEHAAMPEHVDAHHEEHVEAHHEEHVKAHHEEHVEVPHEHIEAHHEEHVEVPHEHVEAHHEEHVEAPHEDVEAQHEEHVDEHHVAAETSEEHGPEPHLEEDASAPDPTAPAANEVESDDSKFVIRPKSAEPKETSDQPDAAKLMMMQNLMAERLDSKPAAMNDLLANGVMNVGEQQEVSDM